jgi:hypothetical protein
MRKENGVFEKQVKDGTELRVEPLVAEKVEEASG